jgi:hypothetical protein
LVHHEHEGSLERHHSEGLEARIEDQRAHCHPFENAWTASRQIDAPWFRETCSNAVSRRFRANKKTLSVRQCLMIARVEAHPLLTAVPYEKVRASIHGLDDS